MAGIFFDEADIINAGLYALEGDWGNAALCAVVFIPAVGSVIVGAVKGAKAVIKAKKAEKILSLAKESKKAVWEMKAVSGADGIRLKTSADESVSFFKQGFAGTDGVAKSGKVVKANDLPNRRQALNMAKDRVGIPRSQQPSRQWKVGDDINMKGHDAANYKYDPNPSSHARYYEYNTPNGKRVIVEHTNDEMPHVHAGNRKVILNLIHMILR